MEMNLIFILISVVLLILGILFVVGEIESEEVDFFGPAALISLIIGVIFWFISNPIQLLNSLELYAILTIVILSVVIIFSGFSLLLTVKMIKSRNYPTSEEQFLGGIGKSVELITKSKEGYIKYKGELWKARSDETIAPKKNVKIIKKEGLMLIVEPEEFEKFFCKNCGAELREETLICSECGISI
ncbi:MAG: NfeD family protein [Promethearchaeota archaeon]